MARTVVAPQTLLGSYPSLPISSGGADLVFTAADVGNGNYAVLVDNKTMVLIYNSDVGAHTVTFTSSPDTLNRTGDITSYSVGAGKVAAFGPFRSAGWVNNTNQLDINGNHATIGIAVVTLP